MKRKKFINKLEQNQKQDIKTVKKKNQDYAEGADPFQNFRMVEDAGLTTLEKGIAVRMSDKLQRIFNLLDKEETAVKDETIQDTLSDLRNYANILQVYIQNKNTGREEKYKIQPVFEGVQQEPIYIDEKQKFEPIELPNGENFFCYLEETDKQ